MDNETRILNSLHWGSGSYGTYSIAQILISHTILQLKQTTVPVYPPKKNSGEMVDD